MHSTFCLSFEIAFGVNAWRMHSVQRKHNSITSWKQKLTRRNQNARAVAAVTLDLQRELIYSGIYAHVVLVLGPKWPMGHTVCVNLRLRRRLADAI